MSSQHRPKPEDIEILLVEDSPTQAEQLRCLVEAHGYRARVAGNGKTAIEAMNERIPDLVLSDVEMPDMDGYALCYAIKSDERWSDTPVVLLTPLADPADVLRGLAYGADSFVRKPYADEYLLRGIEQVLMSRSLRRHTRRAREAGITVYASGQRRVVTAPPRQMLDLLISTYEQAVCVNDELKARDRQIGELNEQLEQRNRELAATSQELQVARRELESFSYSVSHDLRAPLCAVDGYSAQLLRHHADNLSAEGLRCLGQVRVSAYRMAQLIEALLSFAKTSQQPLRRRPVSLAALLDDAVDEFRGEIASRHIDLEVHELPDCEADAALLRQVFVNLLSNALKYTRQQAHPVIEVGCRDEHGAHVIYVKDNGTGLDMHDSDKLFGVFQRLHEQEEFEGTGIGLAIVKRIVERHGGRVWAEGAPGQGATFYLTLEGRAA
jgi:hypothetical protein